VAWFGRVRFSGFFAWLSWLLVHLIFLIGFRNKVSVMLSWVYSYATYKLGARIITGTPGAGHTEATPKADLVKAPADH
jgi:NADH dehydrogenase